jgi:hypothetical protein
VEVVEFINYWYWKSSRNLEDQVEEEQEELHQMVSANGVPRISKYRRGWRWSIRRTIVLLQLLE